MCPRLVMLYVAILHMYASFLRVSLIVSHGGSAFLRIEKRKDLYGKAFLLLSRSFLKELVCTSRCIS
jgi:hypothetical protein